MQTQKTEPTKERKTTIANPLSAQTTEVERTTPDSAPVLKAIDDALKPKSEKKSKQTLMDEILARCGCK